MHHMGIRSKQIDMDELYNELGQHFVSAGTSMDITVPTVWSKATGDRYYSQTIQNLSKIDENSKLFIRPKFDLEKTEEENASNEALFSHVVKATPGSNSITFYIDSEEPLDTSFIVSIMSLN